MPRPAKSKPPASAIDALSSTVSPCEETLEASGAGRDGHVSECSDGSPLPVDVAYTGGFGNGDGSCSCARCLRKCAPYISYPGEAVDGIARRVSRFYTQTASDSVEKHTSNGTASLQGTDDVHAVAENIYDIAITQADANNLRDKLKFFHDVCHEIAEILSIPAAQHGHVNIILVLAEYGAIFDICDAQRGATPLMHAVNNGHFGVVVALMKVFVNPDVKNHRGQTALMIAVFPDRVQAAELLIKQGMADIEAEDDSGRTAMSHAAKHGSMDCLKLLGKEHADVFHKDNEGKTPLQIAEVSSRHEVVTALKKLQQLQTMRMRCEKRKGQKDATQQQAELTADQIAERQATADAAAQALLAEEDAEKDKVEVQKPKAKKPKAKGKAKAAAASSHDNLQAAAAANGNSHVSTSHDTASHAATAHQAEQRHGDAHDTAQPSAASRVSASSLARHESTSQSSPDVSQQQSSASSSQTQAQAQLPPHSQSQVHDESASPLAPQAMQHSSPQAHKSVPSSASSSPMPSPRPRSAASDADSVHDESDLPASASASQLSRAESPAQHPAPVQSPAGQHAFSQQLRHALSPAARALAQQPKGSVSPQKGLSAPVQPASQSQASSAPQANALSDLISAMSRPSSALPSPRQSAPASNVASRPTSASNGLPYGYLPFVPPNGSVTPGKKAATFTSAASPFNPAAVSQDSSEALSELLDDQSLQSSSAQSGSPVTAPRGGSLTVSSGRQTPNSTPDDAEVPSSPPVTTPVRKPPGLPSPVPPLHGQDTAADLDAVIRSDRWPDNVSSKSETTGHPDSPSNVKGSLPLQPSSMSVPSMSGPLSDDGSQVSSQTASETADSKKARLERERRQMLKQEAKHLAGRERIQKREREQRNAAAAAQDKRQQREHAIRVAAKIAADEAKAAKAAARAAGLVGYSPQSDRGRSRERAHSRDPEGHEWDPSMHDSAYHDPAYYDPKYDSKRIPARADPRHDRHNGWSSTHSGSDYDHSPGPASDYDITEYRERLPRSYEPQRGRGNRGRSAGRGGRAGREGRGEGGRGRVRGRDPRPDYARPEYPRHDYPRHEYAPEPKANVDPLAFIGLPKTQAARNDSEHGGSHPDPLEFATGMPSGPQHQLQGLLMQIPRLKHDPGQEHGLTYLLRELRKVVSAAKKQHIHLPHEAEAAISELDKTSGARARLNTAMMAVPVDIVSLELAIELGRECKLLHKDILVEADTMLRQLRQRNRYPNARQAAEPRQLYKPSDTHPYPSEHRNAHAHPEARRGGHHGGDPRPCTDTRQRAEPRPRSESRQPADARQHSDARHQPDARQHPGPRHQTGPKQQQQQYVPYQPQSEPHRQQQQQGQLPEARNGRHEHAESSSNKHQQRSHAEAAHAPRKGNAARNSSAAAAAAAANAALHPSKVEHAPANAAPAVKSSAAQSQRGSHVKDSAGPESDDCVVCWAHDKDVVCIPCGHVAMCKSCSKAVMAQSGLCPVCRQNIREIVQLYRT